MDLIFLITVEASNSEGARTCNVSDAKFTEADTPGISLTARSMVLTHDEQVIPVKEYVWVTSVLSIVIALP